MERQDLAEGIFTISDVLTADECRQLIAQAEERGFKIATINAFGGARVDPEARNNDRNMHEDVELTSQIWARVQQFIPPMLDGLPVVGLNELIRYYRYKPGQRFCWHLDGSYKRANGEASHLTVMIYLNEGYRGGKTHFEPLSVTGKQGMALVFEHDFLHEGAKVTRGVKYVLRSDVMYGPWLKTRAAQA